MAKINDVAIRLGGTRAMQTPPIHQGGTLLDSRWTSHLPDLAVALGWICGLRGGDNPTGSRVASRGGDGLGLTLLDHNYRNPAMQFVANLI